MSINNAVGPDGNGTLEGDIRTYNCTGNYMWSDKNAGVKNTVCQTSGKWSTIAEQCKRVFDMHLLTSFLMFSYVKGSRMLETF